VGLTTGLAGWAVVAATVDEVVELVVDEVVELVVDEVVAGVAELALGVTSPDQTPRPVARSIPGIALYWLFFPVTMSLKLA